MEIQTEVEGVLLRRVKELLWETQHTGLEIFSNTGVAPNQLHNIKTGRTKNPGVNTVETLYVFLSGKPLEL